MTYHSRALLGSLGQTKIGFVAFPLRISSIACSNFETSYNVTKFWRGKSPALNHSIIFGMYSWGMALPWTQPMICLPEFIWAGIDISHLSSGFARPTCNSLLPLRKQSYDCLAKPCTPAVSRTTWTPAPSVMRSTSAARSSTLVMSIKWVAPNERADCRRDCVRSMATIFAHPRIRAA